MTEILYYPLIDCDTDGTENVAMIPTTSLNTAKAQGSLWLEEVVPRYYRLHAKNHRPAHAFNIRCPLCGKAMRCISGDINETNLGLYTCSSCTNN